MLLEAIESNDQGFVQRCKATVDFIDHLTSSGFRARAEQHVTNPEELELNNDWDSMDFDSSQQPESPNDSKRGE